MGKAWWLLGAGLVALTGCSDDPPEPVPLPTVAVPSYTPRPTPSPSGSASTSPSPSQTQPERLKIVNSFLGLRYDCSFVADSFEGKWVEELRKQPDFGVPSPTERYSRDAAGGRADLIFAKAFNAGVGSKDPVRVKAELIADGRVTMWVTKPRPSPDLDVGAAAAATLDGLAAMMSSTRTGEEGSCAVKLAQPLPPLDSGTADDT